MSTSSHTIICGNCHSAVPEPDTENPHALITCAGCGQSDTLEDVFASAKGYMVEKVRGNISDMLKDVARKSSVLSYTPGQPSNESFRWICEEGGA